MRKALLISGFAGLVGAALLFVGTAWGQASADMPILVRGWLVAPALLVFLGLSLAEIPVMVFGLKKIGSAAPDNSPTALALANAFYVFFASVYAVMFLLLTGLVFLGAALAGLVVIRFFSSLLLVRPSSAE